MKNNNNNKNNNIFIAHNEHNVPCLTLEKKNKVEKNVFSS
jgi:hypothetical protein